jgi:anti-sigma regulatory factor (Ser/Thr protein kinase)
MENIQNHKQLIISNDIAELNRVVAFLDALEETWMLPMTFMTPLNLVMEEALTNVIFYAYEEGDKKEIEIDFDYAGNQLDIKIIDGGKPFDPTKKPDPDINLSVEDRPIGGLGIFLIRKIMDEVRYERVGQRNVLSMSKKLANSE